MKNDMDKAKAKTHTVKCAICGREFEAFRSSQKYCGVKCSKAAEKKSEIKRGRRRKEAMLAENVRWDAAIKARRALEEILAERDRKRDEIRRRLAERDKSYDEAGFGRDKTVRETAKGVVETRGRPMTGSFGGYAKIFS